MHFESPQSEKLPAEQAATIHPRERMNERVRIQHALMGRYPEGGIAWVERYGPTFGNLFDTNKDNFLDQVRATHAEDDPTAKSRLLTVIQDRLDAEPMGNT